MTDAYANKDLKRVQERLQMAVNEKQEALALQNAYFSKLQKLDEERKKLRAHVSSYIVSLVMFLD